MIEILTRENGAEKWRPALEVVDLLLEAAIARDLESGAPEASSELKALVDEAVHQAEADSLLSQGRALAELSERVDALLDDYTRLADQGARTRDIAMDLRDIVMRLEARVGRLEFK